MSLRHKALRVLIALASLTVLTALPAPAQASTLGSAQRDLIRNTLMSEGASNSVIDYILSDDDLALGIVTGTSYDAGMGFNSTGGARLGMAVGTSCIGWGNYVWRTQYENNAYGNHLASITLHTDFCYNGKSVTYASSYRTYHIFDIAQYTVWWKGWESFSEGWYAYNNHTNGGVKTVSQGQFGNCVIKYGCWSSFHPITRTYAHYDGSWYHSGSS